MVGHGSDLPGPVTQDDVLVFRLLTVHRFAIPRSFAWFWKFARAVGFEWCPQGWTPLPSRSWA